MQRELLDRANEIDRLIEKHELAIKELERCSVYGDRYMELYSFKNSALSSNRIYLEESEIQQIIDAKKKLLNALKAEFERL